MESQNLGPQWDSRELGPSHAVYPKGHEGQPQSGAGYYNWEKLSRQPPSQRGLPAAYGMEYVSNKGKPGWNFSMPASHEVLLPTPKTSPVSDLMSYHGVSQPSYWDVTYNGASPKANRARFHVEVNPN